MGSKMQQETSWSKHHVSADHKCTEKKRVEATFTYNVYSNKVLETKTAQICGGKILLRTISLSEGGALTCLNFCAYCGEF